MKCPKCNQEYDDSFKFCPNCAEPNPIEARAEAPSPKPSAQLTPAPPKKPSGEKLKPVIDKVKRKTSKKTVLVSAAILLVIAAAVVVAVFLTRPSYPDTINLGEYKEGDLTVGLTLVKGKQEADQS